MNKINKTNQEWQQELSTERYRVMREQGTERPFTGEYTDFNESGEYVCGSCGTVLFSSNNKFESGCGWPSFDDVINLDAVKVRVDNSHNMVRDEVVCAVCGGHLGHVFPDGPTDTTGLRYCINSVALDFKPKNKNQS